MLAALSNRAMPLHERNLFLEAVASISERREWREYVRGMYDEANFKDLPAENMLSGMVAATEQFREHERTGYLCVSVAMDLLGRKNFSGVAVDYCARVFGRPR
jgi:hypothetical protein